LRGAHPRAEWEIGVGVERRAIGGTRGGTESELLMGVVVDGDTPIVEVSRQVGSNEEWAVIAENEPIGGRRPQDVELRSRSVAQRHHCLHGSRRQMLLVEGCRWIVEGARSVLERPERWDVGVVTDELDSIAFDEDLPPALRNRSTLEGVCFSVQLNVSLVADRPRGREERWATEVRLGEGVYLDSFRRCSRRRSEGCTERDSQKKRDECLPHGRSIKGRGETVNTSFIGCDPRLYGRGAYLAALGMGGNRDRPLLWALNLVWQATNDWPQITMSSRIAGYAADNRAQIVPLLWLFSGPLLFTVSATGVAWVLGATAGAAWRAIGIAALVALALVLVTGGEAYYVIGSVAVFMAAGAIFVQRWLARARPPECWAATSTRRPW
jgi:hypothetical protein